MQRGFWVAEPQGAGPSRRDRRDHNTLRLAGRDIRGLATQRVLLMSTVAQLSAAGNVQNTHTTKPSWPLTAAV